MVLTAAGGLVTIHHSLRGTSDMDDGLQSILTQTGALLTSPFALWTYSWVGIGLVLLAAISISSLQLRIIQNFNEAQLIERIPGPIPEKASSIKKRIDRLERHARDRMSDLSRRLSLMLIFGVILPASTLTVIAWYQSWFISGVPALLVSGVPTFASEIEPVQLVAFSLDQALRGGLSDLFEVFGFSVTEVSNNPDNLIFSGLVLGFRFLCGLVAVGVAWLIVRVVLGMRGLNAAISKLKSDHEVALQTNPG